MLLIERNYAELDELSNAYETKEKTSYAEWHLQGAFIAMEMEKTGLHATENEVFEWMNSWFTNNELPVPQVHL